MVVLLNTSLKGTLFETILLPKINFTAIVIIC